jgi:hypothetical protein
MPVLNTCAVDMRHPPNTTISKGSAFLEETRALLRAWQPGESRNDFCDRVLREDLLGRMTAYRARDIVRRVFARRHLRPDGKTALLLKRLLEGRPPGQLFSDLCLLYASGNDDLIRDAVTHLCWPALSEGRLTLAPAHVVEFCAKLIAMHEYQSLGRSK